MKHFNNEAIEIINHAKILASRSGGLLGTEHLLFGMTLDNSVATKLLKSVGFDRVTAKSLIELDDMAESEVTLSARTNAVLEKAVLLAKNSGYNLAQPEHILYSLLTFESCYAVQVLKQLGIDYPYMMRQISNGLTKSQKDDSNSSIYDNESNDSFNFDHGQSESIGNTAINSKMPKELQGLGVDLNEKAEQGKIDPVIGRYEEIERIIQILSRRTKNNPVLIGEPGVGKSAIVEGLAQAIVDGNVPEMLKDKRVFCLDITSLVAGAKYRGEFEERLKNAVEAVRKAKNIIVFIDEIHLIVGAGAHSEGSMDAANILKPMLARGEMKTIGATTLDEYRKYIEKDAALERRFQPIVVNPPSVEETIAILKGIKDKYEAHHKVMITENAIIAAAELSDRYISDRFLPDKAIDLIDEASSRKRIQSHVAPQELRMLDDKLAVLDKEQTDAAHKQDYKSAQTIKEAKDTLKAEIENKKNEWNINQSKVEMSICADDIADIVSKWTGIPVLKLTEKESARLLNLENELHIRVIGQDEAIASISRAVRRARAGLKDPKRPIGSFIFLGPTGVGKTEVSKALAEAMFGDENLMIRLDMSEYMEKFNVSKLIGSAPGYVGYDEGGQLTEKVRRKPYSVILFDEIEKAHPDVFNILLQILDDGRLTDAHGRVVSFKNTIIIMTSNVGANDINKMPKLGFNKDDKREIEQEYERMKEKQLESLKKTMRPEFINRIDDIVIFHRLEREDISKIAKLMISDTAKKLKVNNIIIEVTPECEDYIADKGFDKEYGARPLRRAIQRLIEDKLSEEILGNNVNIGDRVKIDVKDGDILVAKLESVTQNVVVDGKK